MKDRILSIFVGVIIVLVGPYIITCFLNGKESEYSILQGIDTGKDVVIQVNGENKLIDVEIYIASILPGLVDWTADMEIIEAQAVAVRAGIYYTMGDETLINASNLDYTYYTKEQVIEKWGNVNGRKAINTYEKAVYNTRGIIE
ncbi:MAG: hypothetical protein E7258_09455 [Lachnospiraceae bacterium]|nr:hypothetical protein [Lachnospiraceae bacterium]